MSLIMPCIGQAQGFYKDAYDRRLKLALALRDMRFNVCIVQSGGSALKQLGCATEHDTIRGLEIARSNIYRKEGGFLIWRCEVLVPD